MSGARQRDFVHALPALSTRNIPDLLAMPAGESRLVWCSLLCVRIVRLSQAPIFAIQTFSGNWQPLHLESTATAFNGRRWWLVCPGCGRRAGVVFWRDEYCACRQCLGLHYACQHESPLDRQLRRVRKARHAIWGADEPDIDFLMRSIYSYKKPKGMHRETFRRKLWQLEDTENNWHAALYDHLSTRNK